MELYFPGELRNKMKEMPGNEQVNLEEGRESMEIKKECIQCLSGEEYTLVLIVLPINNQNYEKNLQLRKRG